MTTLDGTARLGRYLAGANIPLDGDVAEKAAICLLDAIGLALSAHDEPTALAARELAAPVAPGAAEATIWAGGGTAGPSDAAFANGVAVHAHFQDDTDHDSWSHPGSLVPPAALAAVEIAGGSLGLALRSIVAGYATIQWLGDGEVVSRSLIGRGMRTSPTFGTVGAAAAAAVALDLDERAARSAVGIAASTTGGTLEPVRCGSDEWRIQNGRAAQGGLLAARMAARGVTGAPDALEGPQGFLASLAGLREAPARWARDPDPRIMLKIMAKPFATLGDNMSAALAARVAHAKGLDPTRIRTISVTLWRPYTTYPGTAFKGPFERIVQTQASTAFAVAGMLIHGELSYALGVTHREDPLINALVRKCDIVPDDVGSHLDSVVTVEMEDGSVVTGDARDAPATLIYQDRARAIEVFETRLASVGYPPGAATALAARVFATAAGEADVTVTDFLRDLTTAKRAEVPHG